MKKISKMLCILFALSSIAYGQEYIARNSANANNNDKIYYVGTGMSFNYSYQNMGVIVDSYHFFNAFNNPNDKLLIRFGMGLNYNYNMFPDEVQDPSIANYSIGAIITASLGYVYVLNNVDFRGLNEFGAGFTIDYTYISTKPSTENIMSIQTMGVTLQITLNEYLIGLGAGAVITDIEPESLLLGSPYARINFGITF